jgi:predicted DNA-binding protein
MKKYDKVPLSVRLPGHLMLRVTKLAEERGQPLAEFLAERIIESVKDVELTADDYRRIADDMDRENNK